MAVGTIAELEAEVGALREALLQKERELYEARLEALPWKIGDIVMYKNAEHKIVGVARISQYSAWPRLAKKLKSGEWATHLRTNPCREFTAADVIRHED